MTPVLAAAALAAGLVDCLELRDPRPQFFGGRVMRVDPRSVVVSGLGVSTENAAEVVVVGTFRFALDGVRDEVRPGVGGHRPTEVRVGDRVDLVLEPVPDSRATRCMSLVIAGRPWGVIPPPQRVPPAPPVPQHAWLDTGPARLIYLQHEWANHFEAVRAHSVLAGVRVFGFQPFPLPETPPVAPDGGRRSWDELLHPRPTAWLGGL